MYRDYESPRSLENQIRELYQRMHNSTSEDEQISLHEAIEELEQRANFAWQDEEG